MSTSPSGQSGWRTKLHMWLDRALRWAGANLSLTAIGLAGILVLGCAGAYRCSHAPARVGGPAGELRRAVDRAGTQEERVGIIEEWGKKKRAGRLRELEQRFAAGKASRQETEELGRRLADKGDFAGAGPVLSDLVPPFKPTPGPQLRDYLWGPSRWLKYLKGRVQHRRDMQAARRQYEQNAPFGLAEQRGRPGVTHSESDTNMALALYEYCLTRYPKSPHAQECRKAIAVLGSRTPQGKPVGRPLAVDLVKQADGRLQSARTAKAKAEAQTAKAEALAILAGYEPSKRAEKLRAQAAVLRQEAERDFYRPEREASTRQKLERYRRMRKQGLGPEEWAATCLGIGRCLAKLGQRDEAAKELRKAAHAGSAKTSLDAVRELCRLAPEGISYRDAAREVQRAWKSHEAELRADKQLRHYLGSASGAARKIAEKLQEQGDRAEEAELLEVVLELDTLGQDKWDQQRNAMRLLTSYLAQNREPEARRTAERCAELARQDRVEGCTAQDVLAYARTKPAAGDKVQWSSYELKRMAEQRARREEDGVPLPQPVE